MSTLLFWMQLCQRLPRNAEESVLLCLFVLSEAIFHEFGYFSGFCHFSYKKRISDSLRSDWGLGIITRFPGAYKKPNGSRGAPT